MKNNLTLVPARDSKIDARIPSELKRRLAMIASMRDIELSDIVREALREKVARVDAQQVAAA